MTEIYEKILELREKGLTTNQIDAELNVGKGKITYAISKRFAERQERIKAKAKADEEFEKLVIEYLPKSNSLNNLCNNLGLRGVEGYYTKIKKIIAKHNLSTEHFGTIQIRSAGRNMYTAMSDEEFFIEGHKRNGTCLIKRLLDSGLKEYKCENCGISEWDGKPLRLQIHHINGHHCDNRVENLQILCPNCHTQTDTYARANTTTNNSSFKVTKRLNEILNEEESSFIKKQINVETHVKGTRYCQYCGKDIKGDGSKYCSAECANLASRTFEVAAEELVNDFKNLKSFRDVGRKYGVSDNAIKKRVIKLGVFDEIQQYITRRKRV